MIIADIVRIFSDIDDFCKEFEKEWNKSLLEAGTIKRDRKASLCMSEVMTIVVLFHFSGYRTFKDYYKRYVLKYLKKDFPGLVSYNRFIELKQRVIIPLLAYMQLICSTSLKTGISFVDSTPLRVCHNKRIYGHRVFSGLAKRGKCSLGWFFGFKLHIVVNDRGEIISFYLTPGNVDDRNERVMAELTRGLLGKLFGDRGYISHELFERLYKQGLKLVTNLKVNMKNKLMPIMDKILLRKRALIETINDQLKNVCQVEHSRHRSPKNFLVNLLSSLVAYSFLPKKPSLKFYNLALVP